MICNHSFQPAPYVLEARRCFEDLIRPGRVATADAIATVAATLNTALEIAREYQDEMMMLESMLLPQPVAAAPNVIPLRPILRLVVNNHPGGGDAA